MQVARIGYYNNNSKRQVSSRNRMISPTNSYRQSFGDAHDLNMAAYYEYIDEMRKEICRGTDVNSATMQDKHTSLMTAAAYGRDKSVEFLLQQRGIDVNRQDKDGNTALMYAIKSRAYIRYKESIIKRLIDFPDIDLTIKNNEGKTAWDIEMPKWKQDIIEGRNSSQYSDIDKLLSVKYFIQMYEKYGIDVIERVKADADRHETTYLHKYIMYNQYNLEDAAKREPQILDDINVRANERLNGMTPLMLAMTNYTSNHLEDLKFLLKQPNLNINMQDDQGNTALHYAATRVDDGKFFAEVISHPDIDITIKNYKGLTAYDVYVKTYERLNYTVGNIEHRNELIERLFREKTQEKPDSKYSDEAYDRMMYFMTNGNYRKEKFTRENADELLALIPKINPNELRKGDTPLTLLSQNHYGQGWNSEYVCEMIREFAKNPELDINKVNFFKRSAIYYAIYNNDVDILKTLLEEFYDRIDFSQKSPENQTPLEQAKEWAYHPAMIKLLEYYQQLQYDEKMRFSGEISVEKLKPENNIWTNEEITRLFIKTLEEEPYEKVVEFLNATPLIDTSDDGVLMQKLNNGFDVKYSNAIFKYKYVDQPKMLEEYNKKRAELFAQMKNSTYNQLLDSFVVVNTPEGLKLLTETYEFNPNDVVNGISLFKRACMLDPTGELAKSILNTCSDVDTKCVKISNEVISKLIEQYETTGKYELKLSNIRRNILRPDTMEDGIRKLKEYMLSSDYKPEATDGMGNGIIHLASYSSSYNAKELIYTAMRKGFDINSKNESGQTPLMLALKTLKRVYNDKEQRRNVFGIIQFLLKNGADVNIQDKDGQTPLHYVCATESPTALKLILDQKPNIALEDKNGRRAKYYLANKEEMLQMYMKYIDP